MVFIHAESVCRSSLQTACEFFFSFGLILLRNSQTGNAVRPPIMPARKLGIGVLNIDRQNKPTTKLTPNIAIMVISNRCQKTMLTSKSLKTISYINQNECPFPINAFRWCQIRKDKSAPPSSNVTNPNRRTVSSLT